MRSSSNLIIAIVLFATLTRIAIPFFMGHPPNFSPIDAIALFCGAHFSHRYTAIIVTLLSVWIGDILINSFYIGHLSLFYAGFYWQYSCYVLLVLLGSVLLTKPTITRLIIACMGSATLFFIISNVGVWYRGLLYPMTLEGLITCYLAAIPFFKNTLISDFLFTTILFSTAGFLVEKKQPSPASNYS